MRTRNLFGICLLVVLAGSVAALSADLVTGFEAPEYNGSNTGVDLVPQNGWYVPAAGGVSPKVYTYAGNTPAFPVDPLGQLQFVVGQHPGTHARGQHDFDWSASTTWTIQYDFACKWLQAPPNANNIGSFSIQDPYDSVRSYLLLKSWLDDPNDITHFRAGYIFFAADGTQQTLNNPTTVFPDNPDPTLSAWNNLLTDHWYRLSTTLDMTENRIAKVAITDLSTGTTTTVKDPIDWTNNQFYYLNGGANNVGGLPNGNAFRFFTGGTVPDGNATAVDRLSITASPPLGCRGDFNCDGLIDFNDIDPFVAVLSGGPCCDPTNYNCDVNGNGTVGFDDIDPFVALLSSGATCP